MKETRTKERERLITLAQTIFSSKRNRAQKKNSDLGTALKSPMNFAVESAQADSIRVVHELGASLTEAYNQGQTPMLRAAKEGRVESIRLLHELGASVAQANNEKWTPILSAAQNGHVESIRVLHELGASATQADEEGWTPMH